MKILVRYDTPKWAFGRRAECYAKYPPVGWEVTTVSDGKPYRNRGWDGVLLLDCKASGDNFGKAPVARLIGSHAWLHLPDPADWRTRGVNATRNVQRLEELAEWSDALAVYNQAQREVARRFGGKVVLAPYGVDCEVFRPVTRAANPKLRVGWAYQVSGGLNSFKGLAEVLLPLIAEVGTAVDWSVLTPDANECMWKTELVEWYQGLDVFLCTSSGEGGPQGPFEAAGCGCAVVSTDVGQVSDWTGLKKLGLVVPTYRNAIEARATVEKMARLIRALMSPTLLNDVREKLVWDIRENWNAEKLCPGQLREIFG